MADYDLKAALKRVSAKPSRFVLIKGAKGEQVYISSQAPSAKVLTPIMDECGKGKRVGEGICLRENDQLVFATKSAPSPAMAALVTKVFKSAQCGQYLPAGWRQIGEKEEEEETAEGSTEEAPIPKVPTTPTVPATTPAKAKAPSAPPVDPVALLKKRLDLLLPQIKAAIAAASPASNDLKLKVSEAGIFAKRKDYAEANRLLDEAAALLKKSAPPATPPKPGTAEKLAPGPKPPVPPIAPTAPKPAVPPSPPPTEKSPTPTLTTYVKAKRDWIAAKAASAKSTAAFKAAVLKECDPEIEGVVKSRLDQWEGLVGLMDDSIIQKIDKAIKESDQEAQAEHTQHLAKAIAKLRDALHKHPFAAVADSNPFGKFSMRAPLELVLTRLGASFSA